MRALATHRSHDAVVTETSRAASTSVQSQAISAEGPHGRASRLTQKAATDRPGVSGREQPAGNRQLETRGGHTAYAARGTDALSRRAA